MKEEWDWEGAEKQEPVKKQNAAQRMSDWRKMNEDRKAKLGTKG